MSQYHPSFDQAAIAFQRRLEFVQPHPHDSEEAIRVKARERTYLHTMLSLLSDLKAYPEFADLRVGNRFLSLFFTMPDIHDRFIHIHSDNGGKTYDLWAANWENVKFPNTEATVNHDEVISELKRYVSRLLAGEFETDEE